MHSRAAMIDTPSIRSSPKAHPLSSSLSLSHPHTSSPPPPPTKPRAQRSAGHGGQGGGRAAGREPLLGAPAHRHGGAGRRRGREGLQGAAPGALLRGRGAHLLVLLPGRHRRVPGHLPLPLHQRAHRDGRGGQPVRVQVRHRRHPGHRLELRRHDLRARLLHRRHLRRPHQPRGHLRAVPGQEAVAHQGRVLHRDAVPGRHMRRRRGQGVPDHAVPGQRRRRQLRRARVHQGGRVGRGDRRHVRAGVHRLLRHRRQAQRQRLPRPHLGAAADRVRGVPGAPGDDPHHGHRHQPGEVARRRHHLQQEAGVGRPLDLLGGSVHRRGAGGHLPRGGDPGHPLQEPRLVNQSTSCGWNLIAVHRRSIDHVVVVVVAGARVRGSCLGRARCNNPPSAMLFLLSSVCVPVGSVACSSLRVVLVVLSLPFVLRYARDLIGRAYLCKLLL